MEHEKAAELGRGEGSVSDNVKALSQYFTPAWAARELWDAHFSDMDMADSGLEPTCGDGRMLQAIPDHVPAIGVEIDPVHAAAARRRTGREVIEGDVLTADLPDKFSFVFGNPPFTAAFLDGLLERIKDRMDDGCRCGLILPAYFMQTPSRVVRWNKVWTIYPELLPRTLFPRAHLPLIFSLFTKDPAPVLKGMRLFIEAHSIEDLRKDFREEMTSGRGLWRPIVVTALGKLGGKAHLAEIYEVVGMNRPSRNEWWREKVRQTLQRGPFTSHGNGIWETRKAA